MLEGGIAQWKKKEGESFSAGDVILEIVCSILSLSCTSNITRGLTLCLVSTNPQETDKATIDVEAQDDGVVVKIIVRFLVHFSGVHCLS